MQDLAWHPSTSVFPSISLRRNAPCCTCLLVRMLVNLLRSADLVLLLQYIPKPSNWQAVLSHSAFAGLQTQQRTADQIMIGMLKNGVDAPYASSKGLLFKAALSIN